MKKIYLLICLCIFSFIGQAQNLLIEDFTGLTVGSNLAGQSTWTKGGSGPDPSVQNSTPLTYSGYNGGGGEYVQMPTGVGTASRVYKGFTTTVGGTNTFYYSFLLRLTAVTATGDYFITIGDPAAGTNYFGRVFAKTNGAGFNIGISKQANVAAAAFGSTVYNLNQTYLVVVRYSVVTGASNDEVYVWVNPSLASEPTTGSADAFITTAATDPTITNVGNFLWHNRTANNPAGSFDGVRIAYGATSSAAWTALDAQSAPSISLSATSLTSFSNTCINTTAGPNSFTITGANLTTANVDVAALAGFTYSTSSGGTYTSTLSLTSGGGPFSQEVFVKFTPTAVQSYNGNIVVSGGGAATAVNVAAVGYGVNTIATVSTGGASAITQTTATLAGTISADGCSIISAYGIEYSTTSGFANGSGTQVASTNIAAGNYTSDLTTLTSGTTYYYKAYATNAGGTAYGIEQSFTTATPNPTINVTSLTAFGNVCTNITAGPNSFTIDGANLTTADIAVGPLAGYTFSETSGGTYVGTLTIAQTGGTQSKQVFVKFTPTVVQSYNGNIPVNGGGISAAVDVAVSGAGVNTAATVTTGAASAITQTTATAAGSITAIGCSAVTVYGIEYSLVNGFANGAGTQVASTNLSSGNFSSNLSALTASTTYYYKAYATNGGGTAYGAQQSFTTASPTLTATALTGFGNVCINTTSASNSFTINGVGLTSAPVVVGPLAGYTFSDAAAGIYGATYSVAMAGTQSKTVHVKFTPTAVQSYNGNIPVTGGGTIVTTNVAATGSGVNTTPSVTTGVASNIFTYYATLAGTITANGCSNVTAYGIEISSVNGFADGTGTAVAGSNISGTAFSVTLNNLVQGATYYYKAYAINGGGKSYGSQQTFTVTAVPDAFTLFPVPVAPGAEMRVSIKNLTPGYYGLQFINNAGRLVFQYNINTQVNFINQAVAIPGTLGRGIYQVQLVNADGVVSKKSVLVH